MDVMLIELGVATVMVLLTVALHGAGLLAIGRMLEGRDRRRRELHMNPMSWEGAVIACALATGLMALHGLEIWTYALVFLGLDAINTVRDAVYFSTISYATIGYTDDPIATDWRLLAAIEGVNGTLLMGWSVAFFVTVMTRYFPARRRPARDPS